jgi:ATP-binding cassette subfamily B protein
LLEVAVLAVAGVELAHGRITPGQMLAAGQYVLLGASMASVLSAASNLGRARAAAGRVCDVLENRPRAHGRMPLPGGMGRLEFSAATVHRGGEPALRNLDVVIPAGALVAVVGHSGAGKSMFAALAGGLADPDEGEVLLDGAPLRELEPRELRRAVGYGFERPALIGRTVADAIAFGAVQPSFDEVVAAAAAARADGFIRRLPHGYGTLLAEAPMSGGEAQRVGLARTFSHAERIVVLDDVAASLDTVTEHHISQAFLAGSLSGRTRIIVTHRASAAAAADVVVWLERGAVRGAGPHEVLWREPDYRSLFAVHTPQHSNGRNGTGGLRWSR